MPVVVEADRDILDWSGRKALDYRKQSTSVSASTYSSKYDSCYSLDDETFTASTLPLMLPSSTNAFGSLKTRRHKRFSTTTGVIHRTQSMMGYRKSPDARMNPLNRNTYFSPELDQEKRHQKRYRSILFRKKSVPKDHTDHDAHCT